MDNISNIRVVNAKIACTPFPALSVEKENRGGLIVPKQRNALTQLEVVFPSGDKIFCPQGTFVWVRAEQFVLGWAKEIFDLEGVKFILVPEDQILMVKQP